MKQLHFRQAILTKYLGATNLRGTRVKASAAAGSITVGWDHALDAENNYYHAAMALAIKLGWSGGHELEGGVIPSGDTVFVLIPRKKQNPRGRR